MASRLEVAVAAACAGKDPRRALQFLNDESCSAVSPASAARFAACAAACATALRRSGQPHSVGTAVDNTDAMAATRRLVLEALAFGVPGPSCAPGGKAGVADASASASHARFGICPRGATAAVSALAAFASCLTVWPEALGFCGDKGTVCVDSDTNKSTIVASRSNGVLAATGDSDSCFAYRGETNLNLPKFEVDVARTCAVSFATCADGNVCGNLLTVDDVLSQLGVRACGALRAVVSWDGARAGFGPEKRRTTVTNVTANVDLTSTAKRLGAHLASRWRFACEGGERNDGDGTCLDNAAEFASAPSTRASFAAAALVGAWGGLDRNADAGEHAERACIAAERAKELVASARARLAGEADADAPGTAATGKKWSKLSKKTASAADADAQLKARACALAGVIDLIGPAFREAGVAIHAAGRTRAIDGLVAAVACAAAGLSNLPLEINATPWNETCLYAICTVGCSSARALACMSKRRGCELRKQEVKRALGVWENARLLFAARAEAEAPKRGRKKKKTSAGTAAKQPKWDGLKMPQGTVVETV